MASLPGLRFGSKQGHTPKERVLAEHGLYTRDGYLSYWRRHNTDVLKPVPSDRLMVFRTDRIDAGAEEICRFCGLAPSRLNRNRTHAFRNTEHSGVLEQFDAAYLDNRIQAHLTPELEKQPA